MYKAQGLTLNKVVVDIGKKEFSSGLTYVARSCVCQLKDLFKEPLMSAYPICQKVGI